MPPEPKKPIEELLEASAKARRAEFGANPKMPNPMRARLHNEIARLAREDEPETHPHWLRMWWPRIAIGAAVASLVIGAPVMWWRAQQPGGERRQLASDQSVSANKTNEHELQSAPTDSGNMEKGFSDVAPAKSTTENFADSGSETKSLDIAKAGGESAAALKKFADVAIAPSTAAPTEKGFGGEEQSGSKLRAAPPASTSLAQNRKMEAAKFRQQFSQSRPGQTFRGKAKLGQAANVLNTFQIEQDGLRIRVVDADGSTYTGKIEPIAQSAAQETRKRVESASNEFYFRAAGYNGSLKKPLVFEGNYIATPSPQREASEAAGPEGREQMAARIIGTAKIHGESPVPVDAVSVAQ